MANPLAVADWNAFAKKVPGAQATAPVAKALEFYKGKLKADPDAQVDALNDLIKVVTTTRKKNSDKKFLSYIDDVLDDAEKALKAAEKAAAAAEAAELEEAEDEGEEDDDPKEDPVVKRAKKLLRTRLKAVKTLTAAEGKPFVLAMAPKVCGLMIAKATVSAEHKTQAKALRQGSGRVLVGKCYGEAGKLVFDFEVNVSGGFAKAIKKSVKELLKQTVRVRVVGPGAEGFDDDDDSPELTDFGTDVDETGTNAGADTDTDTDAPDDEVWRALGERAAAVQARFNALRGVAPAAAGRLAPDVDAAVAAVGARAADAADRLDEIDARLASAERAAGAAKDAASAGPARTVGFRKARDDWDKARTLARAQMGKFQKAILSDTQLHALKQWPKIEAAAGELVTMLDLFDESLAKAVKDAEDTNPDTQRDGVSEAARLIREYREELAENSIYGTMDNGAYGSFKVHELLTRSLDQVAAKLGV